MDRLSAMALLVKVTELGSMSAAARALNMPLTTVSRHIGELESALGVRLLARTTRKLTLTDAGVDYVAAARLGVGVARLLHYQALDGLRHGELRLLLENVEPDPAPVHLLYTARDLAPLKLRKFIDFAAPALRQALLRIAGAA